MKMFYKQCSKKIQENWYLPITPPGPQFHFHVPLHTVTIDIYFL